MCAASAFQKTYWERDTLQARRPPSHPVIQAFATSRLNAIKKYTPLQKSSRVLEVGAGNGFFSYYLDQQCQLLATDYSETMIAMNPARQKRVMDASVLDFQENAFDVVFESCAFAPCRECF